MKKQYLVQYQLKYQAERGQWGNAMIWQDVSKRYASTLDEAKQALENVINHFNRGARVENQDCAGLGVSIVIDEKTAESTQVVRTRIRVREVSEWKDCEYE